MSTSCGFGYPVVESSSMSYVTISLHLCQCVPVCVRDTVLTVSERQGELPVPLDMRDAIIAQVTGDRQYDLPVPVAESPG